jgi:Na+-translocating ferredoxin:NAD+ oxidoreductase RnfG subunit
MMGLTWSILGLLTTASVIFILKLSKKYVLNWIAYSGYGMGIFLILFSIAWSVGAVLEGVPRAGSMGMLLFGLPGIIFLTLSLRYITDKLKKRSIFSQPTASQMQKSRPLVQAQSSSTPKRSKSALKNSELFSNILRYGAYLSLLVAFVIGMNADTKDYEAMVRAKFKDEKLTKINDDPIVFQLGEKKAEGGEYILIQEGQGYGGPFVIGVRIHDDAKVHAVMPLDHKETPSFAVKVEEAHYGSQFINKHISDNFIVGDDIDAVSGATVTTMAATEAVRNGAHLAAVQYFKLEPSWVKVPWKVGIAEILILIIFILAFFPRIINKKPFKYVYMTATVAIVGFYLNASVSIGNMAAVLIGYIPSFKDHLTWWILVAGSLLAIFFTGKNVYCNRVCPFYAIEFLLQQISGSKWVALFDVDLSNETSGTGIF